MKILLVSTLKRAVAPDIFASRSRIIYQLAEGLSKKGHTVVLLGTGDSFVPGVKVIPVIEKSWSDLPPVENPFMRQISTLMQQAYKIIELQKDFDIIHNHTFPDFFPHILEDKLKIPLVTTMHAVADYYIEDLLPYIHNSYFVSLSKAYIKKFKKNYFSEVVYNGIDLNLYSFSKKKEDYLLWVGRLPLGKNKQGKFIDPKGVRWAIQVARKTGRKLYLTGAVEDKEFFERDVKPYLSKEIVWVGDVSSEQSIPVQKIVSLMQGAKAFLMTVNQDEPFGLVMAEAMACGTPVIAFDKGAVPEIVEDGKTGFIITPEGESNRIIKSAGIDGLCQAVEKIYFMSEYEYKKMQNFSRKRVEENFSVERMVSDYETIYQKLIKKYVE